MPTPEQALEEMTRENERLGLYDAPVPLPKSIITWYDEVDCTEHKCVTLDQAAYYGQQCAKAARLAALEEAAKATENERVENAGDDTDTAYNMAIRHAAASIRALAAAGVAK